MKSSLTQKEINQDESIENILKEKEIKEVNLFINSITGGNNHLYNY